jgi:aspartate/tyrosine/aromatic aminotransferase
MKNLLLSLVVIFSLAITNLNAQTTGEVGGYDTEDTTYYNSVKIHRSNGAVIAKAVFTYDTDYECYNNIKFYNYQNGSGYVRLKVWVGDYLEVDKKVWISANNWTYLDDVFKHCTSSQKRLTVKMNVW